MKDNMETSMYKELSYRVRGFRVVTAIVVLVTLVLCLLIGIGTWILVSGVRENERFLNNVREHDITIIEGEIREPLTLGEKSSNTIDKVVPQMAEIDFKQNSPKQIDEKDLLKLSETMVVPLESTYSQQSEARNEEKGEQLRPITRQKKNVLEEIVRIANNLKNTNIMTNDNLQSIESTFRSLGTYANRMLGYEVYEPATHRSKRSVVPMMIGNALKYASYAAFAKFMYNEASAITEYKIESRKLHGDPEANFLDQIFWTKPSIPNKPSRIDVVDPSSSEDTEENAPMTYGSDNWTPMVNQVSMGFMSELLSTLLKIMREFLLRDHVMECLWYMFCQDVNHQAKYGDVYGVMARVNSVGLQVLTDRENRESDTINDIWRAISDYTPLQCDVMFPKCDGSKALEIVNDVASGSS